MAEKSVELLKFNGDSIHQLISKGQLHGVLFPTWTTSLLYHLSTIQTTVFEWSFLFIQYLTMKSELALNLGSFCLHVLRTWITAVEQSFNDLSEKWELLHSLVFICYVGSLMSGLCCVTQLGFVLTLPFWTTSSQRAR